MKEKFAYESIINIPRPKSNFKKMSLSNRAAQFHPFSALKGHVERVEETSRFVTKKIEISEENLNEINDTLYYLKKHIYNHPQINITYFVPDSIKDGGKYITHEGSLKKIDEYLKYIEFLDGKRVSFDKILKINII